MSTNDDAPPDGLPSDREQSDADNTVAVESQARASDEREAARVQAKVDLGVTNDRIDALIRASERQSAANEELALAAYAEAQSRIEMQERARLARRRFRVTVLAVALASAVILSAIFVLLVKMNSSLDSGKSVRTTLLDCVQPTGKCYRQGQARTAEIVGQLNKVTALAAACAPDYVTLPPGTRITAIEECIKRGLK